tara:strand:- start:153 stop:380 length:228 start_codon:yes stop_codon:yes gene_type:complete
MEFDTMVLSKMKDDILTIKPMKIKILDTLLRLIPDALMAVNSWFFCSWPIVKIHESRVVIGKDILIKLGIDKIEY